MSGNSAKDLLAQADRLMKKGRTPLDDLPVLTDFVTEETLPAVPAAARRRQQPEDVRPGGQATQGDPHSFPLAIPLPQVEEIPFAEFERTRPGAPRPGAPAASRPAASSAPAGGSAPPAVSLPPGAIVLTRSQFDQRVADKLEELQHAVFSQAMQQLELHAGGDLKQMLREALLPALQQVAQDLASQVAEETAAQVRLVVTKAVEAEVERLRERLRERR